MNITTDALVKFVLFIAYALFTVSMLLPTFAVDLGSNGGPVLAGYKVFLGGPVAALGIVLEPGGEPSNRYLGIYLFIAWLANIALLLPVLAMVPRYVRRVIGAVSALLAWSILVTYMLIDISLIREIGIGYYLWSASITLILFYLAADEATTARAGQGQAG